MWHKTFAGLLSGLVFFLLIPITFSLIIPSSTALMVTFTIVIFLPVWAGIMTYCYAAQSAKQAWLRGIKLALPSALFYFSAYITMGFPQ